MYAMKQRTKHTCELVDYSTILKQKNPRGYVQISYLLIELFFRTHCCQVYRGYVDDPRNTDNAWIETVAMNCHDDTGAILDGIHLKVGTPEEALIAWVVFKKYLIIIIIIIITNIIK